MDDEFFINTYLDNPVGAVLADTDLRIANIVEKVKEAIASNHIDLEEKKREKILERIQSLDRDFFIHFVIAHNDMLLKIEEVKRVLKKNTSKTEQADLQYKMDHVTTKQQHTSSQIGKCTMIIEKMSIAEEAKKIEELARTCGQEVKVVL